jgi:DNA-binding MarR family transcriptional regulator
MNEMFFGLKRAHHAALRLTRRGLASMGLTAARFDLMYVLHEKAMARRRWASDDPGFPQSGLRAQLGVCRSVVSRMVKALVERGYVERRPEEPWRDRRTKRVRLTELGRKRIRAAIRKAMRWGTVQFALDCALGSEQSFAAVDRDDVDAREAIEEGAERWGWATWLRDDPTSFRYMECLEGLLRCLRASFGDCASLYYRWHPDD